MSDISLDVGTIFFTQTGEGIMENLFFFLYSFTFLTRRDKPTDLILKQLAFANILVLFYRRIHQTISAFGWKDFLGDAECHVVLYLQ